MRSDMIAIPIVASVKGDRFHTKWIPFDKRAYDHKDYPTCTCGRKYVQLKRDPTRCIFCILGR